MRGTLLDVAGWVVTGGVFAGILTAIHLMAR